MEKINKIKSWFFEKTQITKIRDRMIDLTEINLTESILQSYRNKKYYMAII